VNKKTSNNVQGHFWVQVAQNVLLGFFLLGVGAFLVGMLRKGPLYVGGYVVEPALYFVGCLAIMSVAVALILIVGNRWPMRGDAAHPNKTIRRQSDYE